MYSVALEDESESTSWEKTLKQIDPIFFLGSVELADPDVEAYVSRQEAYPQSLT